MASRITAALRLTATTALLAGPAMAEATVYRCVVEGGQYDVKIVDGEWYERRPQETEAWTPKGCGTTSEKAGQKTKIACEQGADNFVAAIGTAGCCETKVRAQSLNVVKLRYSFFDHPQPASETEPKLDMAGDCAVLASDGARPIEAWPLAKKIANGMPFVLATRQGGLKLRPGDWRYPERHSYFLHFEGKYYPGSGTWSTSAVGFDPHRSNSYHSCAPDRPGDHRPPCGGIHQPGYVMDRAYTPEKNELVAFGTVYRFDETGTVWLDGRPVAKIVVPDL